MSCIDRDKVLRKICSRMIELGKIQRDIDDNDLKRNIAYALMILNSLMNSICHMRGVSIQEKSE